MPIFGVILVTSGIIIVIFPNIISYILGGLLIFFGMNILLAKYIFNNKSKKTGEKYVKFGEYKIYKD